MKCKYEGSTVWAGRCLGTREVEPCPGYDKCERFKPDYKSNGDWLRSLSDNELAVAMTMFANPRILVERGAPIDDVYTYILGWLQLPYKENEVK